MPCLAQCLDFIVKYAMKSLSFSLTKMRLKHNTMSGSISIAVNDMYV